MLISELILRPSDAKEANAFYKSQKDPARAKPSDQIFVAEYDKKIVAACRLLEYSDFKLIRSMLTQADFRQQGIARSLLTLLLNHTQGPIIAIPTPIAKNLYISAGFNTLEPSEIPQQLINSYRRVRQASEDAPVMVIRPQIR